jgi:hypothetical protein
MQSPLCGGESDVHTPAPSAPPEFVSPPVTMPDLDVDVDDALHRFYAMRNILCTNPVPGHADRGVVEDLLAAIGEEPKSVDEAMKVKECHAAMMEELASIEENQTWSLVHLPKGHHANGLIWVFRLKRDEHDNMVQHKARLIAKGYVQ